MQFTEYCSATFIKFSDFKFRPESVFLRNTYNFGALPSRVVQKVFYYVCEFDKAEESSADVEMGDKNNATECSEAEKAGADLDRRISAQVKTLCTMSTVSKGWYNALMKTDMWEDCIKHELQLSIHKTYRLLLDLSNEANFIGTDGSGKERFSMLKETICSAHKYLIAQISECGWKDVRSPLLSYTLLKNFRKTIENINSVCYSIFSHVCEMTCNFDVLELTLRRGLYELGYMLPTTPGTDKIGANNPLTSSPDPRVQKSLCDPDARYSWEAHIGAARAYADFGAFSRKVITRDFPCTSGERFGRLLAYHLNFPVSDVVTCYRFRTLVSEFGPYVKFAENFERYAMRPGFVGYMNTVMAEEVLAMHYNKTPASRRRNTVLIRYSRKQPDVLAFTSLDLKKMRIEHRRNVYRDGTPIPIGIFVEQHFNGYELLPMGIDDEVITCPNIFKLANLANPHYHYVETF